MVCAQTTAYWKEVREASAYCRCLCYEALWAWVMQELVLLDFILFRSPGAHTSGHGDYIGAPFRLPAYIR